MPKFGVLIATDVWEAAARTLTDFSAEELFDLPILDAFVPSGMGFIQSSGTADAFGSWVELVADVGVGKRLIALTIRMGASTTVEIEVGEGVSGSEVAIARHAGAFNEAAGFILPFWKSLTDNARLALRTRDAESSVKAYYVAPVIG